MLGIMALHLISFKKSLKLCKVKGHSYLHFSDEEAEAFKTFSLK